MQKRKLISERARRFAWRIGLLIIGLMLVLPTWLTRDGIPRTGEEIPPSIQVADQPLLLGAITAAEVYTPEQGWLVITNQTDDGQGIILGHTLLGKGLNRDVMVQINPVRAAPALTAILHSDTPPLGEFNYPSQDPPLSIDGAQIRQDFALIEQAAPPPEGQEDGVLVSMAGDVFDPLRVSVAPGTTVTWRNEDGHAHTVVAEDHLFVSPELAPGVEFSYTFEQPGQYPYYCELYGGPSGRGMSGVIIVR